METSGSILRFARRFFAGTLLSRCSGFMRDMAMAFCFGSAPELAAFMVAYRLANLFRRLLGEGNLQSSFIPHFASLQGEKGERGAFLFYRDTTCSLLIVLLIATALLMGGLGIVSRYSHGTSNEIALLAMGMAPGLVFISLYALNAAFLNCQKSYFVPAGAPVLFNVCWIAFALAGRHLPLSEAMAMLSLGVTVAFAAQWLATAIQIQKILSPFLSWREWLRPRLFPAACRQLVKPMTLGLLGLGAVQINSLSDAIFSRLADPSGPAFLWYAIRIQQLPLALFGIALAGALLPPLAKAFQEEARDRYKTLLLQAVRHSAALMVPATFGLFALAGPGLNLLYGHGDFHSSDVRETLYCLWGYGLGLLPAVFVLLLATGFYARKSYGAPTVGSVVAVLLNATLNTAFVFGLHGSAPSIAVATSLAAWANCAILGWHLRREMGPIFLSDFWTYLGRLSLAGTSAALLALAAGRLLGEATLTPEISFTRSPLLQLLHFGVTSSVFLASFILLASLFRVKEFFELLRKSPGESMPGPIL